MNDQIPAIFELDENGEATGQVYVYCSEECADKHQRNNGFDFPKYKHGVGPIPDSQAKCTYCEKSLLPDGQETFASVTVTRTVTKRQVQSLLVGLFENECSPWLHDVTAKILAPGLTSDDLRKGGKMQDPLEYFHPYQIIPITEGCTLVLAVDDPEDEDKSILFEMTPEAIKKGIEIMAAKYPGHFNDWMEENDDATTSDVFGQCVVYGEEVFC